jgi:Domain of unknown function (DUF397)
VRRVSVSVSGRRLMADVGSDPGDDRWQRSSYTGGAGNCVEVRTLGDQVSVRDSKRPDVVLRLTRAEWRAFLEAVKRGDLDR